METGTKAAVVETEFAADLNKAFDIARDAGLLPNVHGVVAARGERVLFERYWAGLDAARARPLGVVRFEPDTLHDLRSVTKSIVGLLYGIAMSHGQVPSPEAGLVAQFPEYPELAGDRARDALTVRHALTMTLGTEWDETTLPYSDPRNSEIAMDHAADRCRYVLGRPVVEPPGQRWIYNGGATALLARLIAKGTGRRLEAFARETLFEPLGIMRTEWETGADGEAIAASGLRMAPRDLTRIGTMILDGGFWRERRIVPADWLAASFSPAVPLPDGRHYGYQWYLGAVPADDGAGGVRWEETVRAIGNGGQYLFLLPRLRLVVTVLAGNYDAPDQWRVPMTVLRDLLLPALRTGSRNAP
ncbi:serine hydrolase domain-containing protein [Azospirillum agricola]|uniref:serine hydrolase domain-containing protein n=1 Tax=Azospirillum agricola TaxID=1720247 RepID=UPI001F362E7E|nr:serine hydrolase domain-containing protein [Azospirillum agricola]